MLIELRAHGKKEILDDAPNSLGVRTIVIFLRNVKYLRQ